MAVSFYQTRGYDGYATDYLFEPVDLEGAEEMTKKLTKQEKIYLGRRNDGEYEMGNTPASWHNERGFREIDFYLLICPKDFEEITGIVLDIPSKPQRISVEVKLINE